MQEGQGEAERMLEMLDLRQASLSSLRSLVALGSIGKFTGHAAVLKSQQFSKQADH